MWVIKPLQLAKTIQAVNVLRMKSVFVSRMMDYCLSWITNILLVYWLPGGRAFYKRIWSQKNVIYNELTKCSDWFSKQLIFCSTFRFFKTEMPLQLARKLLRQSKWKSMTTANLSSYSDQQLDLQQQRKPMENFKTSVVKS